MRLKGIGQVAYGIMLIALYYMVQYLGVLSADSSENATNGGVKPNFEIANAVVAVLEPLTFVAGMAGWLGMILVLTGIIRMICGSIFEPMYVSSTPSMKLDDKIVVISPESTRLAALTPDERKLRAKKNREEVVGWELLGQEDLETLDHVALQDKADNAMVMSDKIAALKNALASLSSESRNRFVVNKRRKVLKALEESRQASVTFRLERETGHVDELVETTLSSIELLKEKEKNREY